MSSGVGSCSGNIWESDEDLRAQPEMFRTWSNPQYVVATAIQSLETKVNTSYQERCFQNLGRGVGSICPINDGILP